VFYGLFFFFFFTGRVRGESVSAVFPVDIVFIVLYHTVGSQSGFGVTKGSIAGRHRQSAEQMELCTIRDSNLAE